MNKGIYLASASKRLFFYDFNKKEIEEICRVEGSRLMGIARYEDDLYIANHENIYRVENKKPVKLIKANGGSFFHHMKIRHNVILVAAVGHDSIFLYDILTGKNKKIKVGRGTNRTNCIFIDNDLYYITLLNENQANFPKKIKDRSAIGVFDEHFDKIKEFRYGWQSHGFCILKGKKYGLCNYWSGQKKVRHPEYGGLMVDGEIKFKFEKDEFFKDISADENSIYISGSTAAARTNRKHADGIFYILDYDYNVIDKRKFNNYGDFSGCLLDKYDLTN